jgi:predicted methyltransferase
MANVDSVAKIQMLDDRGDVRGVVVHVVTAADLT